MNIHLSSDTICAVATASGGAIGIIRVSGPQAITIPDRIFVPATSRDGKQGKKLEERKAYTLAFGNIIGSEGQTVDEVLVSIFHAIWGAFYRLWFGAVWFLWLSQIKCWSVI